MNARPFAVLVSLTLLARAACAQSAGSDAFLSQLDLNLSQYSETMGLSLWGFNQSMAEMGLGDSREITGRGEARIKGGQATVTYRPVAPTLADAFAASRSRTADGRRELVEMYNEDLRRFRDAQRQERLGANDVAASLGLAFAANYEIYSNGRTTDETQDRDIVEQFRQSLLENAYFQGTNDRYRQLLDETTAVQTVASLALYRIAAKNGDTAGVEERRRQALTFLDFYWPGDAARVARIRLTPAGFRD